MHKYVATMCIGNIKIALPGQIVRTCIGNVQGGNMCRSWIHMKMPQEINMRTHSNLGTTIEMGTSWDIRTKCRFSGTKTVIVVCRMGKN